MPLKQNTHNVDFPALSNKHAESSPYAEADIGESHNICLTYSQHMQALFVMEDFKCGDYEAKNTVFAQFSS